MTKKLHPGREEIASDTNQIRNFATYLRFIVLRRVLRKKIAAILRKYNRTNHEGAFSGRYYIFDRRSKYFTRRGSWVPVKRSIAKIWSFYLYCIRLCLPCCNGRSSFSRSSRELVVYEGCLSDKSKIPGNFKRADFLGSGIVLKEN